MKFPLLQVEEIILCELEANSVQLDQPYISTFSNLKQSYLQLTFPRLAPVSVGYDFLSKLDLKTGSLSDEGGLILNLD